MLIAFPYSNPPQCAGGRKTFPTLSLQIFPQTHTSIFSFHKGDGSRYYQFKLGAEHLSVFQSNIVVIRRRWNNVVNVYIFATGFGQLWPNLVKIASKYNLNLQTDTIQFAPNKGFPLLAAQTRFYTN